MPREKAELRMEVSLLYETPLQRREVLAKLKRSILHEVKMPRSEKHPHNEPRAIVGRIWESK